MAVAKKASTAKAAPKKAAKSKSKSKSSQDISEILVPLGGQVIKFFELTPKKPKMVDGKLTSQKWSLVERGTGVPVDDSLVVGFEDNPSPVERELERAVLVISMKQSKSNGGTWRFALGGVAVDNNLADADPSNDIVVDIVDNGLTLIAYVYVTSSESTEDIQFGYVASFTDDTSGVVSIFESSDPGIVPIRPVG